MNKMEQTTENKEKQQGKWYVLHTLSGHENKVSKSLKQRIESMGFENRIFDIIVPTRDTVKVSQGKKESVKEKVKKALTIKTGADEEDDLPIKKRKTDGTC